MGGLLGKIFPCCCSNENEYVPLLSKAPKDIQIFTTSLNSDRRYKYNSGRLKYLLYAKNVPYEEIDLNLIEHWNRVKITNEINPDTDGVLPALYADGIYVGDYDYIQDLEDHGELDRVLYLKNLIYS